MKTFTITTVVIRRYQVTAASAAEAAEAWRNEPGRYELAVEEKVEGQMEEVPPA